MSTCFLLVAVPLLANDVITFTWTASGYRPFTMKATAGKDFTVDWGDGKTNTYTGKGNNYSSPSHTYAAFNTYTVTITGTTSDCLLMDLYLSDHYISSESVTALDVSGAPALSILNVPYNQLTALDVSKNTALTRLTCNNNQLTALDVSKNTALTYLSCFDNALPLADLYAASQRISDENNKYLGTQTLPEVEVSLNTPVPVDSVFNGSGTTFAVTKNGSVAVEGADYISSGGSFTFHTDGVYTIEITNPAITYKLYPAKVVATYIAGTVANQQITFTWTTDVNKGFTIFVTSGKEFTVDWGDDRMGSTYTDNGNSYVRPGHTYAAYGTYTVTITGTTPSCLLMDLYLSYNSVTALDVTDAPALTSLYCNNNQITELDVSKNTALTSLTCFWNQLTGLDVAGASALTYLDCFGNQLTALDVSKNTALTFLNCDDNQLTALDVSKNTVLTDLNCSYNQLTALDVSKNMALTSLSCGHNQFIALDVSKNTVLTDLNCSYNQLTALDVSKNTALTSLGCTGNQLIVLDVSKNTALTSLGCTGNQLTSLDVSKNTKLTRLWCYNNALSLADLYAASQRVHDVNSKGFGTQTLPGIVEVSSNTPVLVDDVFAGSGTTFMVTKNDSATLEGADYTRSGGNITFLTTGDYTVATSNSAITCRTGFQARVVTTYHVLISDDATLRALTVSRGVLTPAFSANITNYTVDVAYSVTSLTIGATANHAAATVTGDVGVQSLEVGENIFTITVTAEDGNTMETYTIIINRAAIASADATLSALTLSEGTLMPEFVPDITNYTAEVRNSVAGVTIGATAHHSAATVTGNVGVQSLKVGENMFTITVTAEDGTTTKTYMVTITRAAPVVVLSADAMLSALTISGGTLTPVFAPDITAYTVKVKNSVTGVAIAAIAHHAAATVTGDVRVQSLKVGENIFTITVTAEDGVTTKDYTIIVTRAAWDIPYLESLTVSGGDLSPTFASRVTAYTVNMPCGTNSLSLAATPVSGATVEYLVNNTPVTMPLSVTEPGITTVVIRVAAIEGSAVQDYRVTVIRPFASTILRQYWDDVLAVNLNTATNGGYTFTGYQWYRNGQPITGATEAYLYLNGNAFSSTDTYTVHLTTGGVTLAACPLQVSPKKAQATVTAYPNPAKAYLTINNAQWENVKQIDLIDMNGRLVNSYLSEGVQTTINVGGFQTGIYLLRVGSQTISILIE